MVYLTQDNAMPCPKINQILIKEIENEVNVIVTLFQLAFKIY
jgi:hypothetical protein